MTTATTSDCTCLNPYDRCPTCRAAGASPAGRQIAPPRRPAPPRPTPEPTPKPAAEAPGVPAGRELLTVEEVASMLSWGVRTVWRMVAEGKMPQPIRFTRKLVRWKRADVLRYVEGLTGG